MRTLKGFFKLAFIDENTMDLVGSELFKSFKGETTEQTAAAVEKVAAGLRALTAKGQFTPAYNPGAKKDHDVMAIWTYCAKYEDNGQMETPPTLEPKCDLDSVEMEGLKALFNSL